MHGVVVPCTDVCCLATCEFINKITDYREPRERCVAVVVVNTCML